MALRGLARQVLMRPLLSQTQQEALCSSTTVRLFAAAPTVFDKIVQFYVIDKSGTRHTVRGLEGASLARALIETRIFEGTSFMPNPINSSEPDCHVYVGPDYIDKLPELDGAEQKEQAEIISDYVRANARPNSRMARYIHLTPQLNGMTVALGPIEPWNA